MAGLSQIEKEKDIFVVRAHRVDGFSYEFFSYPGFAGYENGYVLVRKVSQPLPHPPEYGLTDHEIGKDVAVTAQHIL